MKLKNLFLVLIVMLMFVGVFMKINASQRVHTTGVANSYYNPKSNYTIVVTSSAVTTIAACAGWREVYIGSPTSTAIVYFRADTINTQVTSKGWWIPKFSGQCIETNGAIHLQAEPGASAQTLRVMTFQGN